MATIFEESTPGLSAEKAAEKIQAQFRGYKTRKSLRNNGPLPDAKQSEDAAKSTETIEENPSKSSTAKKTIDEELADIDLTDVDLEKAATKIQASYRNFTKKKIEARVEEAKPEEPAPQLAAEEGLEDLDLEDPQLESAALKIQSTFRGYKVRKEVLPELKSSEEESKE